jgi:hypothetical protein
MRYRGNCAADLLQLNEDEHHKKQTRANQDVKD